MSINFDNLRNLDFKPEELLKDLFITESRVPYVEIYGEQRLEVYPVYSEEMKNIVTKAIYKETGRPPSKSKKEQVISTIAAEALYNGAARTVWTRCAQIQDGIEIDLNNASGQCIRVKGEDWSIESPTSSFYRPSSSRLLVTPRRGANWEIFKKHFKTKNDDDLKLIIGFLLSALRPSGPYPILVLQGEQGSAKSTTAKMLKTLIDPSIGSTRGLIKKEQDLFIAARNNHLISFDNISLINNDLSDTLCRLATGGSFSARTLYTNDGETLIELCKPILLNGITDFVTRPDLASRSIIIELAPIPENERRTLTQVMNDFNADLPHMLGVLMDGLSSAIANERNIRLERMPRMADVVLWCTAAEAGLRWSQYNFLEALESNQLNAVLNHLSTDPVAIALQSFMVRLPKGRWKGTATELLGELNKFRSELVNSKAWPSTPNYLSQYLSRLAPNLRKIGLDFVGRDRTSNQRLLIIEKLENFTIMNLSDRENGGSLSTPMINRPSFDVEFDDDIVQWDDAHDDNDDNRTAN